MISFALNLLLSLAWGALVGRVDVETLGFGFVLGYLALLWLRPLPDSAGYVRKLPRGLGLFVFFLWELLLSSFRVAFDVVTPRPRRRPGIVAVPLDAETDAEITLLACLVTLTPGSISLDVSEDRKYLYIHAMFVTDPDRFRREVKEGFERRVLEFLR